MSTDRKKILESLINFNGTLAELRQQLGTVDWDSPDDLVKLSKHHVLAVLEKQVENQLSLHDLSEWANLIECREDIGFEIGSEHLLEDILDGLANPDIHGKLTNDTIKKWISRLK